MAVSAWRAPALKWIIRERESKSMGYAGWPNRCLCVPWVKGFKIGGANIIELFESLNILRHFSIISP